MINHCCGFSYCFWVQRNGRFIVRWCSVCYNNGKTINKSSLSLSVINVCKLFKNAWNVMCTLNHLTSLSYFNHSWLFNDKIYVFNKLKQTKYLHKNSYTWDYEQCVTCIFFLLCNLRMQAKPGQSLALILGVHVLNPQVYKYSKLLTFYKLIFQNMSLIR